MWWQNENAQAVRWWCRTTTTTVQPVYVGIYTIYMTWRECECWMLEYERSSSRDRHRIGTHRRGSRTHNISNECANGAFNEQRRQRRWRTVRVEWVNDSSMRKAWKARWYSFLGKCRQCVAEPLVTANLFSRSNESETEKLTVWQWAFEALFSCTISLLNLCMKSSLMCRARAETVCVCVCVFLGGGCCGSGCGCARDRWPWYECAHVLCNDRNTEIRRLRVWWSDERRVHTELRGYVSMLLACIIALNVTKAENNILVSSSLYLPAPSLPPQRLTAPPPSFCAVCTLCDFWFIWLTSVSLLAHHLFPFHSIFFFLLLLFLHRSRCCSVGLMYSVAICSTQLVLRACAVDTPRTEGG